MLRIIFHYALRNIVRTPLRSFFTLFSVSLIIMLYTVLTSIGNSFTKQISTVLERQNIDIVIQAKYAATPMTSIIDDKTVNAIVHLDNILTYDSLLIGRKRLYDQSPIFILGVSDFNVFARHLGFNIIQGNALQHKGREIVIGKRMAELYHLNTGDEVALSSGKKYMVSGIFSSWLNFLNSGIISSLEEAQKLMHKPGKTSIVFLTLDDTTKTAETIHKINEMFPDMRAIESQQLPDYMGSIKNIFYFSKIVSVMTLLISIAVLLNTFIMAISERTKEIGILNAIGWSRHMIVLIFLVESLLLSFGGGLIGYISSYPVMLILLNKFANISMYIPQSPSLDILLNVMIMSFLIGVFSALFPALYGTKINIAKAIRHE
jgi:putative ABC transport system permease protein